MLFESFGQLSKLAFWKTPSGKVVPTTMLVDSDGNPASISGGGSSGGGFSDVLLMDSTGQLFVYRDVGTSTPSAYAIPSWATYTPVGAVSTTNQSLTNYAQETGGNLAAINSAFGTDGATPPAITGTGVRGWLRGAFEKLEAIRAAIVGGVGVTGTFWQATQPVSGTIAVSGTVPISGNVGITGQVEVMNDTGNPLPVSGTVAVTGVATEATLTAQSEKLPATIGQKVKSASLAVTLASDQGTLKTAEQAGSGAMRYLSDTTALTAVAYSYVQVITDTVFATLTNGNSTAGTIATLTIPAGTVLRGTFTAISLTSGAVALYV